MNEEILLIITMSIGILITLISILLLKKSSKQFEEDFEDTIKKVEDFADECIDDLNNIENKINTSTNGIFAKIDEKHNELLVLYDLITKKQEEINKYEAKANQVLTNSKPKETINDIIEQVNDESLGVVFEPSNNENTNINSVDVVIDDSTSKIQKNNNNSNSNSNIQKKPFNTLDSKENTNKTEEIVNLSKQGLTTSDIAKKLNMGKGEVQLILELRGE